jgi:hypothetical protein
MREDDGTAVFKNNERGTMLTPDFKTFRELAREGNLVAVTREIWPTWKRR